MKTKKGRIILLLSLIFVLLIIAALNIEDKEAKKEEIKENEEVYENEREDGIVTNIWAERSKIKNLREHNIKYLFVDIGGTTKDGKIGTPEGEINGFLQLIRDYEQEEKYEFVILAYSEIKASEYDLTSKKFKENYAREYTKLANKGFDGMLVDIEGIPENERKDYLTILDKIRKELPKKSIISVYAGAIKEKPNEWEWSEEFYKEVGRRVDMISASGYDTDIKNGEEYKKYLKEQIREINKLRLNTTILFAIPTHKEYPEGIDNALEVYDEEMKNDKGSFKGIVVFAEWTMDEQEWESFEKFKIANNPTSINYYRNG